MRTYCWRLVLAIIFAVARYLGGVMAPMAYLNPDLGIARDCILSGNTVLGTAYLIERVAGLTFNLQITNAPLVYNIGGRNFRVTTAITGTVTNNADNFVWIDDTRAFGVTTLPCNYLWTAPGAPATDQHWYDLGNRQMKRWSGAAWVAVNRVFVGYLRADGGTINAQNASEPLGMTPWLRVSWFGEGQSGTLNVNAGTTTINGALRYFSVIIRGTAVVNTTAGNYNPLNIRAQSIFIILDTATINLAGLGRVGGAGGFPAANPGLDGGIGGGGGGGGGGTAAGGNGGGRAALSAWGAVLQSAGGAAGANPGVVGANTLFNGAGPFPAPSLWHTHGAGGGEGGPTAIVAGGAGGNGGGGIGVAAPVISWAATTTIFANGTAGAAGGGAGLGGGGGGGGGFIYLVARGFFNNGATNVTGGAGGAAGGAGAGAGAAGGTGLAITQRI